MFGKTRSLGGPDAHAHAQTECHNRKKNDSKGALCWHVLSCVFICVEWPQSGTHL